MTKCEFTKSCKNYKQKNSTGLAKNYLSMKENCMKFSLKYG